MLFCITVLYKAHNKRTTKHHGCFFTHNNTQTISVFFRSVQIPPLFLLLQATSKGKLNKLSFNSPSFFRLVRLVLSSFCFSSKLQASFPFSKAFLLCYVHSVCSNIICPSLLCVIIFFTFHTLLGIINCS